MTTLIPNSEHLRDEIAILKLYLLREVRRLAEEQGRNQLDDFQGLDFQGLVLSEREVLSILTAKPGEACEDWCREIEQQIEKLEVAHSARAHAVDSYSALRQLSELFDLNRFEQQCLILCLAPEIEPRYAKVYAFLQDDVTRKLPCAELAVRLFCPGRQKPVDDRGAFSLQAPLRRYRLLECQEIQEVTGPLSNRWLRLDERIAAFLLGRAELDSSLDGWVEYLPSKKKAIPLDLSEELFERTARLADACFAGGEAKLRPVLHLHGRHRAVKRELAEYVCGRLGLPLLVADAGRIPSGDRQDFWWRLSRESLLQPAAVFIENFDDLLQESRAAERQALLEGAGQFSPLTFLSGQTFWRGMGQDRHRLFLSLECTVPDASTRTQTWKRLLGEARHSLSDDDIVTISSKFPFTSGQVREAISTARNKSLWMSQPSASLDMRMLNEACRGQAAPNLGQLARLIKPAFGWDDLVLPGELTGQLREIAAHVTRAQVVLEQWGFQRKLPYGRGVTGLFHGGSGTGKTMAVSIIAADLGLDLYKIDLSMVVSKYIGETEKNLNRVFAEAQDSSAILFFDEADALFGKRSQVKDAHDRYANIETAYLLQCMEDYSGIVILATNMKGNMDDAFVRRLRFILHFPFPNQADRERIWRSVFPQEAPLGADVDLGWLAWKLKIAGGTIKNISLRAAFLAAERKGVINMDCVKDAAKWEIAKTGMSTDFADFQATSGSVLAEVQEEAA